MYIDVDINISLEELQELEKLIDDKYGVVCSNTDIYLIFNLYYNNVRIVRVNIQMDKFIKDDWYSRVIINDITMYFKEVININTLKYLLRDYINETRKSI